MKEFFNNLPLKKAKVIIVFVLITLDVSLFTYIYKSIGDRSYFNQYLEVSLDIFNPHPEDQESIHIPQEYIDNLHAMTKMYTKNTLIFFFIFHLLVYALFYRGRKGAWGYVKLYSILAAMGMPFMVFSEKDPGFRLLFSIIAAGCIFNALVFLTRKYSSPPRKVK